MKVNEYLSDRLEVEDISAFAYSDYYTAAELIAKVDEQFRNSRTEAYKLSKINEAILELYDGIGTDKIAEITTTEDIGLYSLPADIAFDQIASVTISESAEDDLTDDTTSHVRLIPIDMDQELMNRCYFKARDRVIGIYPTPDETDQVIRIMYQARAPLVTATTDNVELSKDFGLAVQYFVMAKIAEASDDMVKRNNFIMAYDDELIKISEREYKREGRFPGTRDVLKPTGRTKRAVHMYRSANSNDYYRYFPGV